MAFEYPTCLSKEASKQWLSIRNYEEPYHAGFTNTVDLATPRDSGAKCALIKSILTWLPSDGECLLYVTCWGVWPSCENEELFHRVRESLGVKRRPLIEGPGQLLNLADRPPLECMLDICLYNFWDAMLADDKHRFLIMLSHDEFVTIACVREFESEAQRTVAAFTEKQGQV